MAAVRGRRKRREERAKGLPGWLATFADMVTLLLTFFVMLMAMANFDDTLRVEAVMQSIEQALGSDGYDKNFINTATEVSMTEIVRRQESVQPVVVKLRQAMAKHISDDMIRIVQNEREVRVRLDDRVFFKPGLAELHPAAYALVADLAVALRGEQINIDVEGHTDATGDERANWELSSDRAVSVVLALRERGPIQGSSLRAVGRGAFHPGSKFGEESAWNRRVEFVLQADHVSAKSALDSVMRLGE